MPVNPRVLAARLQQFAARTHEVPDSDRNDMDHALVELNRLVLSVAKWREVDIHSKIPEVNIASAVKVLKEAPFDRAGDQEFLVMLETCVDELHRGLKAIPQVRHSAFL